MTISVIIPLYNKARHIERSVHSVLRQAYPALEVIVIDDGSSDGGADVARGIRDTRVQVVSTENRGVSAARNLGVELANSDLVAFLDADDEWMPDFLETVAGLHGRFPAAGIYATAYQVCSEQGSLRTVTFTGVPTRREGGLINDYFAAASHRGPIISSAVMARKSVLKEVGGFPESLRRNEDLDTWMRVALRYPVAWSPNSAAIWYLDTDNRTKTWLPYGIPPFSASYDRFNVEHSAICSNDSAREYIAKYELIYAMFNLLASRRDVALVLLRSCRNTRKFRCKWLVLRFMASLPLPIAIAIWKVFELKCGRTPELPSFRDIHRTKPYVVTA